MESAQDKVRYVIYAKVEHMLHHKPTGWYVHFLGSHESIFLGIEQPDFAVGDTVKITFERISPDALPQGPSI